MTIEDLKTKTSDELKKVILDLRKAQFNARFQKSQGTLENTAQIRKDRRNIARAKTLLSQQKNGIAQPKKAEKAPVKTKAKKKTA